MKASTTTTAASKPRRTRSDSQAMQSATIAMLGKVWNSLDDATRASWVSMAQQMNVANGTTVGVQPKVNPYLTFISINTAVYASSGTVMNTAPTSPVTPPPVPPGLLNATMHAGTLSLVLNTPAYANRVLIYAAAPVPAGTNIYSRKSAFKLIGSLQSLTASNDLSRLYNAKFRGAGTGSKIALKIVGISASGIRSAEQLISGVTSLISETETQARKAA